MAVVRYSATSDNPAAPVLLLRFMARVTPETQNFQSSMVTLVLVRIEYLYPMIKAKLWV